MLWQHIEYVDHPSSIMAEAIKMLMKDHPDVSQRQASEMVLSSINKLDLSNDQIKRELRGYFARRVYELTKPIIESTKERE